MKGVKIVTYNILSSRLCRPEFYINTPEEYCDEDNRFYKLELKLRDMIKDNYIICLQEVSLKWAGTLKNFFYHENYEFINANYGNIFNGLMGVAVAFPKNMYELEACEIIRVGETLPEGQLPSGWKNTYDILQYFGSSLYSWKWPEWSTICEKWKPEDPFKISKERRNSILILILQNPDLGKFVIGNYHMPCIFRNRDVMTLHATGANICLQRFAHFNETKSIFLVGDFNILPNSDVYNTLLNCEYNALPIYSFQFMRPLKSAHVEVHDAEPKCTHRVETEKNPDGFEGTLDYIFYRSNRFQPIECNVKEITHPLPSITEPSDHIPVMATFRFQ